MGSDGIYDKMTDDDIGKAVWLSCATAKDQLLQGKQISIPGQASAKQKQSAPEISVHQHCGLGVEGILKNSLYRQSLDNVTVVMIAFSSFKRHLCNAESAKPAAVASETQPTPQKKISSARDSKNQDAREKENSQLNANR